MFRVAWLKSAVDELASFWIDAETPMRTMITAASAEIDRRLAVDPQSAGESRDEGGRIDFVYPLSVTYQIDLPSHSVTILHVRVYRRRQT